MPQPCAIATPISASRRMTTRSDPASCVTENVSSYPSSPSQLVLSTRPGHRNSDDVRTASASAPIFEPQWRTSHRPPPAEGSGARRARSTAEAARTKCLSRPGASGSSAKRAANQSPASSKRPASNAMRPYSSWAAAYRGWLLSADLSSRSAEGKSRARRAARARHRWASAAGQPSPGGTTSPPSSSRSSPSGDEVHDPNEDGGSTSSLLPGGVSGKVLSFRASDISASLLRCFDRNCSK
mmetsp:Transcript_12865/g.25744  ORF Transcript_12865/g.25744 Transcript_12865/m.25744 type:complete len:240 (-) Transcript_12865:594-1313(-)